MTSLAHSFVLMLAVCVIATSQHRNIATSQHRNIALPVL
jgi:hypothetical protein